MDKKKKVLIASLGGIVLTTALITTPLLIIGSNNEKKKMIDQNIFAKQEKRYNLLNKMTKADKSAILSCFYTKSQLMKLDDKIYFQNIKKDDLQKVLSDVIYRSFALSRDNFELKIDLNINDKNNKDEYELKVIWYFINKKSNLVDKIIKYYDILNIYFLNKK